ncbi:MAG: hypothetical protein LIQ30_04095 [Planctomycetes bacterium]|nr:hypothetical protein [Planctomycetota bacterium]
MELDGYEFIDSGNGRRLERFAGVVVDRPAPAAVWTPDRSEQVWRNADLRFDRDSKWTGEAPSDWRLGLGSLTLTLRPAGEGRSAFSLNTSGSGRSCPPISGTTFRCRS